MFVKFQLSTCSSFRDMTGSQIYPSVGCWFLPLWNVGDELGDTTR